MATNEYQQIADELAKSQGISPPEQMGPPAPTYDISQALKDESVDRANMMKQSMYVAAQSDPDRTAEVMKLSQRLRIPSAIVERNYDDLAKKQNHIATDYQGVSEENPILSKWLTDPENAKLSHDDIDALKSIEGLVNDHSTMSQFYSSLKGGAASFMSDIAKVPALAVNIAATPYNLAAKGIDNPAFPQVSAPEGLINNPVSKYFDKIAQENYAEAPMLDEKVFEELSKGNIAKAAQIAAVKFASSAPQQAAIIAATVSGAGIPALIGAGVVAGAGTLPEARKAGVTPLQETSNAVMQGAVESAFERIGTFGILKHWESAIAKKYGKQVSGEVIKDLAKTLSYSFVAEGNEEAWTSVAQDLSAVVTGVDPDRTKGIGGRALESFAVGGFSGGVLTGPAALASGHARAFEIRKSNMNKNFYLSLEGTLDSTKLKKRLPEKQRELVDEILKDGPVENVYIPVDVVDQYFQSKNLKPATVMHDLNALKSYTEAKESGSDVKIKMSDWANKIAGSEHYQALQNDIKFSPEDLTVNQINEETKILKEQDAAAQAASEVAPPADQTNENALGEKVAAQLEATGVYDKKQAKILGGLTQQISSTLEQRAGLAPGAFSEQFPLNITGPDQVARDQGTAPSDSTTLEQGPVDRPQVPAFNSEVQTAAVNTFGKTVSIKEAGYILPDGSMLDLSGRHYSEDHPSLKNQRYVDHRELGDKVLELIKKPGGTEGMLEFQKQAGALRVMPGTGISANFLPSKKQIETLVRSWNKAYRGEGITVDVDNPATGETISSVFIEKPSVVSIQKVFSDVLKDQGKPDFSLFQGDPNDPRGKITFGTDKKFNISLLEGADLSTFIHETGHFYVEVMGDLANRQDASEQFKEDYKTLRDFVGAESGAKFTVDQHEKIARAFEAYLLEGKAPTTALRKAFANIKAWMISVYRSIKGLNVELTDEVRGVFDRLIATDEQLAAARNEQSQAPLFSDPAMSGMSEEKAKAYLAATLEAKEYASNELEREVIRDWNAALSDARRQEKKVVKAEIEKEVNQLKEYRALSILQNGTLPDGSPLPDGLTAIKLDKAMLLNQFGREYVSTLPTRISSKDTGMGADMAANLLGYESGAELLNAINTAEKKQDYIDRRVKEVMDERYPDIFENGKVDNDAMAAIHNDSRAKVLRMELEHLASNNLPILKDIIRRVTRRVPSEKMVRERAAQIIGDKNISDIKPIVYQRAEAKAAKEAGVLLAKGDVDGAFDAKKRELLNHELYRAAVEAKESVDKAIIQFKKIARTDEKLSKTRDVDLVGAAKAILSIYGIGKLSEKHPASFLEKIKRYDPDKFETVMALVEPVLMNANNFKAIPLNQFIDLRDSVEAIWSLAKSSNDILIDGKKMSRDIAISDLQAGLADLNKPGFQPGKNAAVTEREKLKLGLLGFKSALTRVEHLVDLLDQGNFKGAFRKYIWQPISDGVNKYRIAKKDYILKYEALVKGIEKTLTFEDIYAPELGGYKFNGKAELLGALLHSGNESNLSKLIRGNNWGVVSEDGSLDRTKWDAFINRMIDSGVLTKQDFDFVQNVWDLFESMKPDAQKVHKDLYGFYFNEITANEFTNKFGTYRGGYAPAVVDPLKSTDAQIREEQNALEKNDNSFMFPTAGRGWSMQRVEAYARPLMMDLRLVPMHVDKVLRFVHIEPRVKDVGRIIFDRDFRAELDRFDPTMASDVIVPWLQRSAQQSVVARSKGYKGGAADRFFSGLRKRSGMQQMAANVINTLQQLTGISISALKVKPSYLRDALWNYTKSPTKMLEDIISKSDMMKTRATTQGMEIQSNIDDLMLNPTKYNQLKSFAMKHGYILQQMTQNVVDVTTWAGAYDQAIASGVQESEAIQRADSAVRLTQGSFNAEDVSRFETGTPFARLFTMFYSYFNMQANVIGTEAAKTIQDLGLRKGAGRLVYIYTMGMMIPAVMGGLISQALSGRGFDEDDDGEYLDDFMALFFNSQFKGMTALVPIVGPSVNVAVNKFNDKRYDDNINASPMISLVERSVGVPSEVYKAIQGKGRTSVLIRDSLTALGLMTGLPLAPLAKPLGYIADVQQGKVEKGGPVDTARGLITGTGPKK